MARALRVARALAALPLGVAVLLAASGWLYVLRPHMRRLGPGIVDALPLDELSHRAGVSLLPFLLVWTAAALLLGLLARFARAGRLTAALLLTLAVGAWGYLASGVSILAIRQVPASSAFDAAAHLYAVWAPAALAGLGGAVLGRAKESARSPWPLVLGVFVAAAGALDVVTGILPRHGVDLLTDVGPGFVMPVTSAVVAPAGVVLLLLARGLARRKRAAWLLALPLVVASTALHFLHGVDYGAAASALLTLALVARRHDFDGRSDPSAHPRVAARAAIAVAAIYAYGAAALWVNRLTADQPFTATFAVRETTRALVGLNLHGSQHLTGAFGAWFPSSVLVLGAAAAIALVATLLGPWRYGLAQEARERELARMLVAAHGDDTLAPFVLRADKSYFFAEGERAFVAYRVVGGVAVVSGDPIGPAAELECVIEQFVAFARARDWRVAILGASQRLLPVYRRLGLHALYHGDEGVVDVAGFSLEGRAIRKVRQSVHRLEKAGYTARALHPAEIDGALRAELEAIAREWRGSAPERGFAMALDALFRLDGEDALFVIGFGPSGAPEGFLHFAVSRCGACALSLSSMPRLRTTPNGFNEWLVCAAIAWAREHSFARVSLNFSPFAALLAPQAELTLLQRIQRRALLRLKGRFQLDNLLVFNRKFMPLWEPRFVVYERRRDLPRVGIAALAAEAYLPGTGRR